MGNAGNSLEGYQPMEPHADLSALDDNSKFFFLLLKFRDLQNSSVFRQTKSSSNIW